MVPTGSKRAVLGTLKPMHFSFVTKLMIFGKFDHLHLPQPQGRHGKVHQKNVELQGVALDAVGGGGGHVC